MVISTTVFLSFLAVIGRTYLEGEGGKKLKPSDIKILNEQKNKKNVVKIFSGFFYTRTNWMKKKLSKGRSKNINTAQIRKGRVNITPKPGKFPC